MTSSKLLRLSLAPVCLFALAGLFGGSTPAPVRASAGQVHTAALIAAPADTSAETALRLQSLLGQHSVLAADMMRARLRGDPDFVQAANAALGRNTEETGKVLESLVGEHAEYQFAYLWTTHVQALFNYARGLAEQDESVRDEARKTLISSETEISTLFVKASNTRLTQKVADATIKQHVNHLLEQADAYAARDYPKADAAYRTGYAHTCGIGRSIAIALVPADQAAVLKSPQWRLRSELDRLLGEHIALAVAALRAAVANSPDFEAAADAVNGNTRDLAAAVDSLFGPQAAKSFQSLWADHIDSLMAYTAGVVRDDDDRRTEARAKLATFERELAKFLDAATGQRLTADKLAEALSMHDDMLLREVDALAKKQHQEAHDIAYETYQHMYGLAGQLAAAFGSTTAARMPRGGIQTGHGGMHSHVEPLSR